MVRVWWVLVAAAACKEPVNVNEDLVPAELQDELVFVQQTIQLQPDEISPTFTMRVPRHWIQDRSIVGTQGGQPVLTTAGGVVNQDFRSRTTWGDPAMRDGFYTLHISCEGDCALDAERRMFETWSQRAVIKDVRSATERTLIVSEEDGDIYLLRVWWLDGDSRFRSCWVRVAQRYAAAYRAFEKSCANVLESAP